MTTRVTVPPHFAALDVLEGKVIGRGVLVIDDTAMPKKSDGSVGVAPQYSSSLGKTANCQTLVSLTLARGDGVPVMVALRLFVRESWTSNPVRLKPAGVPVEHRAARSKPEIALAEIDRLMAAGICFCCVPADAGYGLSAPFRQGAVGYPTSPEGVSGGGKTDLADCRSRSSPRAAHSGCPVEGGRRHAGQCQVAKCELAKRDQGSAGSSLRRSSRADRRWTSAADQGHGPAASSRGRRLAHRRTQDVGREEILSRQSASQDGSAHISRHDQSPMDLRTGPSAVERGTGARSLRGTILARPPSSCPHDHDRLRIPPVSSSRASGAEKKNRRSSASAEPAGRTPSYRRTHRSTTTAAMPALQKTNRRMATA
jgi:DDE superfamily endonuclease